MPGAAMSLDVFATWCASQGKQADFTVPLKQSKVLLSAATKECFDQGKSPAGDLWAPLRHPRANSRGGDKPLRDKDLLMASATAQGAGHVEQLTQTYLVYGSNLDYAGVHQFGATIPERRRPYPQKPFVFPGPGGKPIFTRKIKQTTIIARPFLGIGDPLAEKIQFVFADWQQEQMGR
jgi:phage gpG-like protein